MSQSSLPAWKAALLEAKKAKELEKRKQQQEEIEKMNQLPRWKRDLLLRKGAGNGHSASSTSTADDQDSKTRRTVSFSTIPRHHSSGVASASSAAASGRRRTSWSHSVADIHTDAAKRSKVQAAKSSNTANDLNGNTSEHQQNKPAQHRTSDATTQAAALDELSVLRGKVAAVKQKFIDTTSQDRTSQVDAAQPKQPTESTVKLSEARGQALNEANQEADAERKRQEEAEAERKRQEEAEAERKRQGEAEAERKRQEEAQAERKRQEEAQAERKRQGEAEAERKRQEEAQAERKRQEEAQAERKRQEEAEAERKRQEEAEAERKRQEEAEAERKRQEEAEAERKRQEEAEAERKRQEEAEADDVGSSPPRGKARAASESEIRGILRRTPSGSKPRRCLSWSDQAGQKLVQIHEVMPIDYWGPETDSEDEDTEEGHDFGFKGGKGHGDDQGLSLPTHRHVSKRYESPEQQLAKERPRDALPANDDDKASFSAMNDSIATLLW